jgi:shikimate dehydrogenase
MNTPPTPRISGRTTIVGIIGDPVAHSRSPAMHNAAFRALRLDWLYVAFHVDAAAVREAVRAVRALGMAGVNVTVPHKEEIVRHLDTVSDAARHIGAVNTIVNRDGALHGENTDVIGFVRALRQAGAAVRNRHAVVIGAGGSARAVLAGLAEAGAARITLANRTAARARALARRFNRRVPITATGLDALDDGERLADAAVVINATSLGLGSGPFPALSYAATPRTCLFFDLLYGRDTEFLRRARRAQRTVVDGSEMLVQQGACAFALWTGRRAPVAVMREALCHDT